MDDRPGPSCIWTTTRRRVILLLRIELGAKSPPPSEGVKMVAVARAMAFLPLHAKISR